MGCVTYQGKRDRSFFVDYVRRAVIQMRKHNTGRVELMPLVREPHGGTGLYETAIVMIWDGEFLASFTSDEYEAGRGHNERDKVTRRKVGDIGAEVLKGIHGAVPEFTDDGVLVFG